MVIASPGPLIQATERAEYTNESQLLAACRRRDIAAFEQVFLDHGARLKSIACQLLGNRSDAEDAVQETFIKLYRGIDRFQGQSSLGTWLCRILINACHDQLRKRQRDAAPTEAETGAHLKTHLPLKVALQQALERIHPRYRMVFLLFEVEGLKHAEIAAIMEVPEGTSKAWLFEAKKELKRMLTEIRP
jgi:RNA polymerase sigma-70 factor, ECF subfamily